MSQQTAQPFRAPLPGHRPWYQIETHITGRNAEGWAIVEPTGRAKAGCSCGQSIEWGDKDEVIASLAATCFGPHLSPPPATPEATA